MADQVFDTAQGKALAVGKRHTGGQPVKALQHPTGLVNDQRQTFRLGCAPGKRHHNDVTIIAMVINTKDDAPGAIVPVKPDRNPPAGKLEGRFL